MFNQQVAISQTIYRRSSISMKMLFSSHLHFIELITEKGCSWYDNAILLGTCCDSFAVVACVVPYNNVAGGNSYNK